MIFQNFPLLPCRDLAVTPGGSLFCCNSGVQDGVLTKWGKCRREQDPDGHWLATGKEAHGGRGGQGALAGLEGRGGLRAQHAMTPQASYLREEVWGESHLPSHPPLRMQGHASPTRL